MKKYFLLGVLIFAGCVQSDYEYVLREGLSYDISINSEIQTVDITKSAVNQDDALSSIRFLKIDAKNPPPNMTGATPFYGNRANGGSGAITFTDAKKPLYSRSELNAYFVAYYPGVPAESGEVVWIITGSSDILLTDIWDAGKYNAPLTGINNPKLRFQHQLAQLEVVCRADASQGVPLSVVQAAWGNVVNIFLVNTFYNMKYTYASNRAVPSGKKYDIVLLNADYNSTFTSVPIAENSNKSATAAGMFAPSTGVFKLIVKTANVPVGVIVDIQLMQNDVKKDFEIGKKHIVTLNFMPDGKSIVMSSTVIEAWSDAYRGSEIIPI